MTQLLREIDRENAKLAEGWVLAIRLNGTSDIDYENVPVLDYVDGKQYNNVFEARPNVQFYDYTKRFGRLATVKGIPNYHLTFSRAETKANHAAAQQALAMGVNVTVVFRGDLPEEWNGFRVVDGDTTDIRFWDQREEAVIIGLKAKGRAIYDDTGFVVD